MMKAQQIIAASLIAFSMMSAVSDKTGEAVSVGDLIKVGGITYLVDRYAGEINTFINKLTVKHGISSEYATKVVPLLTVGEKGYIGAAQVSGPQALVDQTKAALQFEDSFMGKTFRIKGLIPVDAITTKNYKRVQGVGVSAQIDVKI
jgi:hypothetical protein